MIKLIRNASFIFVLFLLCLVLPSFIFAGGGGFSASGDPGMANGKGVYITYTTAGEDLPQVVGKKAELAVYQGSGANCTTSTPIIPADGVISGQCFSKIAGTFIIGLNIYTTEGSQIASLGGVTIHFQPYVPPVPTNTPTPTITPTPVATATPTPVPPTPTPQPFLQRTFPRGFWYWVTHLFSSSK